MITCVLCVRDLTERLYSVVKPSPGFWQGKREINMCPGEKNGSSWICRLDVIQSLSKNVLSLGQHAFIKCFLCDRHCVTFCEHRGAQDTSFILGAYEEAHQKGQECRRWFRDNVLSAMTEAVTGMMAGERRLLSSAWVLEEASGGVWRDELGEGEESSKHRKQLEQEVQKCKIS